VILVVGLIVLAQGTGSAVPVVLIVALALAIVAFAALIIFEIAMARHRPVTTGASGLENEIGVVRDELTPVGMVFVHGERWRATTEGGAILPVGTPVRILAVQDLTLVVEAAPETATTLPPLPGAYDVPSSTARRRP
jgi:membrane-bound serine protease (ClpP class)